jgi:putative ABC transport system permease protein
MEAREDAMNFFDPDRWQEIRDALASNKTRTFLTAFGVFWGIFMLVVMLGSGKGLENGTSRDFEDGATNSFFVWTRATSKPYKGLPAGRRFELNNADTAALREKVLEVAVVAPRNQLGGFRSGNTVSRGKESGSFNVMGDYPEIRVIQSVRVRQGRFLNDLDIQERRKVAVIGSRVAEELFEADEEPIGDHVRINGVYFKIVGVHYPLMSGNDGDRDAQTIYIPFTTFQTAFNFGDEVGWFAITSQDGIPASVAEEKVLALLKQQHRVAPDDDRAIGHWNMEQEYQRTQALFAGIRMLVWIVGIGTLAAGVIGVSNIMLVIVRERTNEIGIRRAIGATPWAIRSQIVIEAIVLTSLAGYLGLMAGVAVIDVVASFVANSDSRMFLNPNVSLGSALQALLILILSGTLAGLIPAQRAVAISPVEALRN